MLNLAGPSYDFGNVLYAVLQECEHKRRALLPNEAPARLVQIAGEKLAEIRSSYREAGGSETYWRELEREVLETAMPQYAAAAAEQTRLERSGYDVWRKGDALSRVALGLGGLALGLLVVALPFIPLVEDAFALAFALAAVFYPEIRRGVADYRHSRFLNRLIAEAERYQKDGRIHYVSHSRFDEALRSLGDEEAEERPGEGRPEEAPLEEPPPAGGPRRKTRP